MWPDLEMHLAARGIEVVVLEEHGGRQHDVGQLRRVGHELLVDADEQVVAQRSPARTLAAFGSDRHRVGVLDQHRVDRRPAAERVTLADQDRADPRLVELADGGIDRASSPSIRVLSSW